MLKIDRYTPCDIINNVFLICLYSPDVRPVLQMDVRPVLQMDVRAVLQMDIRAVLQMDVRPGFTPGARIRTDVRIYMIIPYRAFAWALDMLSKCHHSVVLTINPAFFIAERSSSLFAICRAESLPVFSISCSMRG